MSEEQAAPVTDKPVTNPLHAENTTTIEHAVSKLIPEPEAKAPVSPTSEPEEIAELEEEEETTAEEPKSEDSDSEDEEETPEEEDDYEPEDTPEAEGEEAPDFYAVKIDGEEYEVSLDELRSGYQRQKDYTKKTQALAEDRKATTAKSAQLEQLHNEYLNQAQLANELLNRDLKVYEGVDWEGLKQTDPIAFMQKRIELQDLQSQQNNLQEQAQQAQKMRQDTQAQEFQEYVKGQQEAVNAQFPDWKDTDKREEHQTKLAAFARAEGFTDEELASVVSARDLKILDMARKFSEMKKSQKGAAKKVRPAIRKVAKAQSKPAKGTSRRKKVEARQESLRKSGSLRDAAALMYEMQTQKAIRKQRG
jgi:hypothetical protein